MYSYSMYDLKTVFNRQMIAFRRQVLHKGKKIREFTTRNRIMVLVRTVHYAGPTRAQGRTQRVPGRFLQLLLIHRQDVVLECDNLVQNEHAIAQAEMLGLTISLSSPNLKLS